MNRLKNKLTSETMFLAVIVILAIISLVTAGNMFSTIAALGKISHG